MWRNDREICPLGLAQKHHRGPQSGVGGAPILDGNLQKQQYRLGIALVSAVAHVSGVGLFKTPSNRKAKQIYLSRAIGSTMHAKVGRGHRFVSSGSSVGTLVFL